ncbi:crossover junction endodeoxyribonuclease RuvC [Solidesulfovibrio carbinoliphilus subsp. oakridgensis]|uniref:Crossover junction endodeoxyribonuclease RuvC n=1 Tax=Solidesulfovibrio carbinoliphilus subsp. oakridgensis TaxID=694327 RepID=G7Q7D7_9BACT|nr:crossover junction endodeoxyribonuclease RuvC [Solidesulfovibrio carbinoliphilus]EHJ49648.1 crossover junction endodeoxyribonuclease RuvC [Solidesulfovibrio carbinoliphilus subsp. oakridgensis]
MESSQEMMVLGLDPGSRVTGYGVVRERSGVLELVAAGVVRTGSENDFPTRLGVIYTAVAELIGRLAPIEAAVENVFVSKNAGTALKLGQARGAALAACAVAGLPVFSYEPTIIKKSLVGTGRAEKSQVAFMVGRVLSCRETFALDATDALAAAVCHLNQRRLRRLCGTQ